MCWLDTWTHVDGVRACTEYGHRAGFVTLTYSDVAESSIALRYELDLATCGLYLPFKPRSPRVLLVLLCEPGVDTLIRDMSKRLLCVTGSTERH